MQSNAQTVEEYIQSLPEDRRQIIKAVREVIRQNLQPGFTEDMQWGMICYSVPLETFPDTYNKQPLSYVALASQKNYISLYLTGVYGDDETRFRKSYAAAGKKLDMGKSCLRFKRLEDLDVPTIAQAIARYDVPAFIAKYKAARG